MSTLLVRLGAVLALVLAIAGTTVWLAWEPLADFTVERFAAGLWAEPVMLRDGDLHVVLCGTAGPVADAGQRSACNAVVADGEMLLVDAGGGGPLLAGALGLPIRQLSTILVTHLHHDHLGGIADAIHGSWFLGRTRPVAVYGPPGIEEVMRGLAIAYAADRRLRALPGAGALDPRHAVPAVRTVEVPGNAAVPVLERGRLRVRAFRNDHGPVEPSLGYRIELADRAVVFNGDARADADTVRHARGADLLVNATVPFQWILTEERIARAVERSGVDFPDAQRVMTLFSSPVEIARVAQEAGVPRLVLSHRMPMGAPLRWLALWGVSDVYDGEVAVGVEGMRFDLATDGGPPAGPAR
ncbi:MAG: MBL fold metallo-hydrolase [Myxococcota bacterium]|nr:MBL fold metallo-hydrolase [Myxococcota bacterium]